MSLVRAALLACALSACAAAPAGAVVRWSGLGGDAGRSGAQPLGAGSAPVTAV
jgi:hypothetical protein